MAKKKRGAPTRKCENCGNDYHPRRKECPECGTPNPKLNAPKKRKKRKVAKKRATGRQAAGDGSLAAAIRFVEEAGSLRSAQRALEQIERIKQL